LSDRVGHVRAIVHHVTTRPDASHVERVDQPLITLRSRLVTVITPVSASSASSAD